MKLSHVLFGALAVVVMAALPAQADPVADRVKELLPSMAGPVAICLRRLREASVNISAPLKHFSRAGRIFIHWFIGSLIH